MESLGSGMHYCLYALRIGNSDYVIVHVCVRRQSDTCGGHLYPPCACSLPGRTRRVLVEVGTAGSARAPHDRERSIFPVSRRLGELTAQRTLSYGFAALASFLQVLCKRVRASLAASKKRNFVAGLPCVHLCKTLKPLPVSSRGIWNGVPRFSMGWACFVYRYQSRRQSTFLPRIC